MHRIDTATAVAALPAPAAPGVAGYFSNGSAGPGTPQQPTNFDQDWCNDVQEELVAVATALGDALDKTNHGQVLSAIKRMIQGVGSNYAADTGTANTYAAAFTPALTGYAIGAPLRVKIGNTNTGASTFNPNGLGAKPIVTPFGNPVPAGMLKAGRIVTLIYDGTSYQIAGLSEQNQSLAGLGAASYFILPGGIIVQFGLDLQNGLTSSITFPVTFPVACLAIIATKDAADNSGAALNATATTVGATFYVSTTNAKYWLAIGH